MQVKIGIAGPIGVRDIAHLLDGADRASQYESRGATLLATLIEALLAKQQRVVAFTTEASLAPKSGNIQHFRGQRLDLFVVPQRRTAFRPRGGRLGRMADLFMFERNALLRAFQMGQPTMIHAHWSYEYAWAAQASGLPCLITCHDSPMAILAHSMDLYRLGRLMMAWIVLRRALGITAVSPYLSHQLRTMTRKPISIVPNPIPALAIEEGWPRSHPGRGSAIRVAMVINGWSTRKNATPAMAALAKIQKARPNVEITLVGPGFGLGEEAAAWAEATGISDAFHFAGGMPYREVIELLGSTDILVHPALEESFGMTIAEAMALGIPVVAGEGSGAVPWVVGGADAALLVDVRSREAIADAVGQLIDNPCLYERLSQNARARALKEFSPASVAEQYLGHYAKVLGSQEREPFSEDDSQ